MVLPSELRVTTATSPPATWARMPGSELVGAAHRGATPHGRPHLPFAEGTGSWCLWGDAVWDELKGGPSGVICLPPALPSTKLCKVTRDTQSRNGARDTFVLTQRQAHVDLDSLDKSASSFPFRVNEPSFKLRERPDPTPHAFREPSHVTLNLPNCSSFFLRY